MKKLCLILLLLPLISYAWENEKIILQGIESYADEMRLKSVYQIGSQVYLQIEFYDDPMTVHSGGNVLFSEERELPIPSFMSLITLNDPPENAILLFENETWIADYTITPEEPLVLTYDMHGSWDVTHYPWVYNEDYGWTYITPVSNTHLHSGAMIGYQGPFSRHQRWIFKLGFGWMSKFNYYPIVQDYFTPVLFE